MKISNLLHASCSLVMKKKFCKINTTIPGETIETIEKKYHFQLPAEYREFICKVGNGGTLPLPENDFTELFPFDENLELRHVTEEFPCENSCDWGDPMDGYSPFSQDEFLSVENRGYIQIASANSCQNTAWLLIVTGIRRGEMWLMDDYRLLRLPGVFFDEWLNLYCTQQLSSKIEELSAQRKAPLKPQQLFQQIQECMAYKRCEKIQWNPPIPMAEVRAFENEHHITLPTEYVTFITEIADGCSNFFATNSNGQGGTMFCLKDFADLKKLEQPFLFSENTEQVRSALFRNYDRQHSIWQSELFAELPAEEAADSVWISPDYSRIPGVLPFARYNDTGPFGMNTQALLVLNGPLKGQIWKATKFKIIPDGQQETLYSWMLKMMQHGVL